MRFVVDKFSERVHTKIATFSQFLRDHTAGHGLPQIKCPSVKKLGSFSKIPLLKIKNDFSNRSAFPKKHQILSILMKVTLKVQCSFYSKNLITCNITRTQARPLFSFYCKCFQTF